MFRLKFTLPLFILKIVLFLFPFLLNSSLKAQVKTGIYKIDYRTDAAFLNNYFSPYNQQNTDRTFNIKTFYNYQYKNLVDSSNGLNYVLIINKKNPGNKEFYTLQMVWLAQYTPEHFNLTYSDSLPRKFVGMEIYVGQKRNYWNAGRPSFNDGFIWNQNFDRYSADDSYRYKLSDSTFYSDSDLFILKSKKFELISDSVKVDSSTYYSYPLGDSGYKTATKYLSYKQDFTTFKLKEAKAYQSFLYLPANVKFYTGPLERPQFKELQAGDFIAVTKETEEWYWGEHVSTDGKVSKGRIYISDLWIGKTKSQTINGLRLHIKYSSNPEENSFPDASGSISGIRIYSNNKLVQVIKDPGLVKDTAQIIHPVDVNFDGYPDLQIYSHSGGAGPNYGNNYYLYNPKTKRFDYHAKLSDLSQPEINVKTKSISAAWRNGAGNYGSEKYKWINRQLIQVEYYEIRYLDENQIEETHHKMIKGKMRKKTRILKDEEAFSSPR
ncbi:XAC2610-related protein [Pedobacter steynii]|uniref:Uncharacterized protein n=1 Tax=Pedobacter steynii TaxID=430522 RepID=A0A1D7QPD6_9SPHI|nr:hypothetical protein [Pedobacter steynii]AOM80522.1 hypothetical protein BFS30_27200 [Pedobacter steynii]